MHAERIGDAGGYRQHRARPVDHDGAAEGRVGRSPAQRLGFDIACGDDSRRVFFAEPLGSAEQLRPILVELARQGRRSIAQTCD